MGTVVFYLYQTIGLLSQTSVSDQDRASAMHAFSECVGFTLGFRGLELNVSVITMEEVDELLEMMRVPATGAWTPYVFWQNPAISLGDLQRVLNKIQSVYGFTETEMDNFAYNWVELQQR